VPSTEGESFAKSANALFFKTSAKENIGVHEAFEAICGDLYKRINETNSKDSGRTRLTTNAGGKSDKKCSC